MGSIQRGGIIRKNGNGTLERVDSTNTYIGSATLENGRIVTKRFRCIGFKEDEVAERWLKWQWRETEKAAGRFGAQSGSEDDDKESKQTGGTGFVTA